MIKIDWVNRRPSCGFYDGILILHHRGPRTGMMDGTCLSSNTARHTDREVYMMNVRRDYEGNKKQKRTAELTLLTFLPASTSESPLTHFTQFDPQITSPIQSYKVLLPYLENALTHPVFADNPFSFASCRHSFVPTSPDLHWTSTA